MWIFNKWLIKVLGGVNLFRLLLLFRPGYGDTESISYRLRGLYRLCSVRWIRRSDWVHTLKSWDQPQSQRLVRQYSTTYGGCQRPSWYFPLQPEICRFLIQHQSQKGASTVKDLVDLQNERGNTALHWSSLNGKSQIVALLLENSADPQVPCSY